MRPRLGIIPDAFARPLFRGLRGTDFDLFSDSQGILAAMLRECKLDGAFLSSIDAAKDHSGLSLVPGPAVVARRGSESVSLIFRENLHEIKTVAADFGRTSEIVLLHLIMLERHEIKPQIVARRGTADESLAAADAVLAVGDDAVALRDRANRIDLIEEWEDITGAPFVHGLWFIDEEKFTTADLNHLRNGADTPDQVQPSVLAGNPALWYSYDDRTKHALSDFFKMAFYHGILGEVPEFSTVDSSA